MRYERESRKLKIRKYILISLSVLLFAAVLVFVYSYFKRLMDPVVPAIKAVPESTVCMFKIKNPLALWERIDKKNHIWNDLKCLDFVKEISKKIHYVDSVSRDNADIAEIFEKNPLYISWVPDRAEYQYLFTINLNGPHNETLIDKFMHQHFSSGSTFSNHQFLENEIFEIHINGKIFCAYTVYKGIFIIAQTSAVVEASLSALLTGISIENDTDFIRLNTSAGKNVDINIFIKNSYIDNLLSGFFDKNQTALMKMLSVSGSMIASDLTIKNDELLFAGYAYSGEAGQLLNKLFSGQKPQPATLTRICPSNTAFMAFWGLSNITNYVRNYTNFINSDFHGVSYENLCAQFDSTYKTSFSDVFLKQINNEFALIITENPDVEDQFRHYAVFRARSAEAFNDSLKRISVFPEEKNLALRDSFAIRKLVPCDFLNSFFGRLFEPLDTVYYTVIEDYIVMGETPLSLDLFVSAYLSGKTLDKNINYIGFSDNVSDESNFCIYTNIRRSFRLLAPLFNNDLSKAFIKNEPSLKNIQAIAFQLAAEKNKFFLNAYLKHNSEYVEENPAVWEFAADTTLFGKISVVTDPHDSTKKVLFFDVTGKLYMLDRNGQLIWKKQFKELPLSRVYITNLKKNNTNYLLFNTKNHIYILGLDGKMADFSPVKLPFTASTAITLIEYSGKNDYRIIIPCENQKIYNYQVSGKPTAGWNNFRTEAKLLEPVEYFRFRDKDIMIGTDKNGKVYFINRKGNQLIRNKQPFIKAKNSRFFTTTVQGKQYLLTTDRQGKLIFISENGKIDVVTLKTFTKDHFFLTGDFDMDKKEDFIFIDQGKAFVFNHEKKKIFEKELNGQPSGNPFYTKWGKSKFQVVFPDSSCTHLVFFNNNSTKELINYTLSSPEVEINTLYGKNFNSILVLDGNLLLNYILD